MSRITDENGNPIVQVTDDYYTFDKNTEKEPEPKHIPIPIVEITLRDQFASAVLNGFFASGLTPDDTDEGRSIVASRCYEMADAMIEEREK